MEPIEPENTSEPNEHSDHHRTQAVLPKPVLIQDKKNWVRRSIISLLIYAFLFYTVFDQDIIYIAAVLVVLMIHELGHFFAMKAYHYNDVKLFVLPMLGAFVSGTKSKISQRQMCVVILAGPLPGIIIGFCLLISTIFHPNERLEMLGNIFFVLNLFNLLPFVPLDGGRLLETLFVHQNHAIRVVFTILSIIAMTLLAILAQSIILLILPAFMVFDLIMKVKNQKIKEYLDHEKINYVVDYSDLPDTSYWTIRDCIILSFNKRYAAVEAGVHKYSILEGSLMQHVISVLEIPFIKDIKTFGKILMVLLYIFFMVVLPVAYMLIKFLD
ncbi:MAG: peptidase [Bacteroidetes bacterium]|nr:peptidase [Bacteroidota bacterium]MDF2453163.1 peptidase [Bacteroidota bacterium]